MSKNTFSPAAFRANMIKYEKEYEGMVSLKEARSSTKEQPTHPVDSSGRAKSISELTDAEFASLYGGGE